MGNRMVLYGKCLVAVCFVLVSGCCYSCGAGQEAVLLQAEEQAQKSSVVLQEGSAEQPEMSLSVAEQPEMLPSAAGQTEVSQAESGQVNGSQANTAQTEGNAEQFCWVHVCGQVENPGVYQLLEGQRIYEAIDLAGGFTEDAADTWLNLAEPVLDGMKLKVPSKSQVEHLQEQVFSPPLVSGSGANPDASGGEKFPGTGEPGKVNLNSAAREELMTLAGIGEAKADAILRYRQEQGGFQRIEDIMNIPGIKEAIFQKIKDHITV